MSAPPKRVRLRTPEGGTVIFDLEEQAAILLRRGYPQAAIERLRPLVSADLHAAIADTLNRGVQRKRGRPSLDPIEEGIREADFLKAELVRSVVLLREQEIANLRRKFEKGAVTFGTTQLSRREMAKLYRSLKRDDHSPVDVANEAAAETIEMKPATYAQDRRRKFVKNKK